MRASFSLRSWAKVGLALATTFSACHVMDYTKEPDNVRPIGRSKWHVVTTRSPGEIDTVHHHLYYKRGLRYQSIEDLAGEYRLVPPDCLTYRGLKVVGRPMYAMCGHRTPAQAWDTTITEADLLAKARTQPPFGRF
jgi:hypothetical protein